MEKQYIGLCCDECLSVINNGGQHEDGQEREYYRAMLAGNRSMHKSADYVTGEDVGFKWQRCATCNRLPGERHQVYLLYSPKDEQTT